MKDQNLSEEQTETLDKLVGVADLANETLEKNNEILEKLKDQLNDPATRDDVLFSVIKNSTEALIAIDAQFTDISLRVESMMRGHNDLVAKFNQTVGNREWLAAMVDTRLEEREKLLIEESQIAMIKDRLSSVRHGMVSDENKPALAAGQIRTFIRYPMNPEQFSEEDLDRFSSNVVETAVTDSDTEYKKVLKTDNKILFSAVSLFFSEYFTTGVQEGKFTPSLIKTLDGKDYVLLDIYLDVEIQGTSTEAGYEFGSH